VTGWNYKDGSGGAPVAQYCYYNTSPELGHSSARVDIAFNGVRGQIDLAVVPDVEGALRKCQWWH
jgi:hypothetical protein